MPVLGGAEAHSAPKRTYAHRDMRVPVLKTLDRLYVNSKRSRSAEEAHGSVTFPIKVAGMSICDRHWLVVMRTCTFFSKAVLATMIVPVTFG